MMKALALSVLALTFVGSPGASANPNSPSARASRLYLTMYEARREIRHRARQDARESGNRLEYLEITSCLRYSNRRIRCDVYREETHDATCEGQMQVIEFREFFRTRGYGTDCY
jgi:hypothetical protein